MDGRRVLHSWKDIANYLSLGVRTLQRYEAQQNFPVRRVAGRSRTAVFAFSDEVDAWMRGKRKQFNGYNALTLAANGHPSQSQIQSHPTKPDIATKAKEALDDARAAYLKSVKLSDTTLILLATMVRMRYPAARVAHPETIP